MSKSSFVRPTSILASLFLTAVFFGGCAVAESGESDDELEGDVAQMDDGEEVGESADALKFTTNPTTGSGTSDPTGGCGWFCPWWAKDLSDCIIRVCNNAGTAP